MLFIKTAYNWIIKIIGWVKKFFSSKPTNNNTVNGNNNSQQNGNKHNNNCGKIKIGNVTGNNTINNEIKIGSQNDE
jgi:hypothetical protein